jgi:hypothetical protein
MQFQGTGKLDVFYRGQLDLFEQLYTRYTEVEGSQARKDIPAFSTQWWSVVTLRASDLSMVDGMYTYGMQDLVYNGGQSYGQTYSSKVSYPAEVSKIRLLMNRLTMPSLVFSSGIDYTIVDGRLCFKEDPMASSYVVRRPIYGSGNTITDYEVVLWGFSADVDHDNLWRYIGCAYNFSLPASQRAGVALNAIIDSQITGLTSGQLRLLLAALSGVPSVLEAEETVEDIVESDQLQIITDKNVYSYPLGSVAEVAVGDVVHAGDQLVDTIRVQDLGSSTLTMAELPATISLGSEFIGGSYTAPLVFANEEVALDYIGPDDQGIVEVRFAVTGEAADISAFWTSVHAQGKALGRTLANALDTRETPVGEPAPVNLPATVNPMRLVLYELMRSSLLLIRVKTAQLPTGSMLDELSRLRSVFPPTAAYILFSE